MKLNMRPHGLPGSLIVVCGPDGTGKTTLEQGLVRLLAERGVAPDIIMQPTNWWRADERVKANMVSGPGALSPLALALFGLADRVDQQEAVILPALSEGRCVLSNRYLLSLAAHYLTTGEIDQVMLEPVYAHIVAPDVLIVLDAPTDVLLDRVVRRDGEDPRRWDQRGAFVERNRAAFRSLAEDNGGLVISTLDPEQDVLAKAWEAVAARLDAMEPVRGTHG